MKQFLETNDEEEFAALSAEAGAKIDDGVDLINLPNHVLGHPMVMQALKWKGTLPAKEAATLLLDAIGRIHDAFEEDEDEESSSPRDEFVKECHLTLAYLWATSKGLTSTVELSDPPETDMVQEACEAVRERLRPEGSPAYGEARGRSKRRRNKKKKKKKSTNRRGRPSGSGGSSSSASSSSDSSSDSSARNRRSKSSSASSKNQGELTAALVQNVNELTAYRLEERKTARKKTSMMSRMGPETEKLFKLLSARDWDEKKPDLNKFVTKLMEDKGMSRAIEMVRSEMRQWEGTITDTGLVQFLSGGYICKTMDDRPGGFTIFMFRPSYVQGAHNTRFIEQSIREIFGDAKLGDETVKFYSKMNYFLPPSFEDFMIQLMTCVRSLELFTSYKGIASEGYRTAHRIISVQSIRYRPLFATDPLMGVKIGRFLDNIFQNFVGDFSEYIYERRPIGSARAELRGRMAGDVKSFFKSIRNGIVPSVVLPATLTPAVSVSSGITDDSSRGSGAQKSRQEAPGKQDRNDEVAESVKLPAGKRFGDFFTPSRSDLKDNCLDWPTFPHHVTKQERPMCVKFQTMGACAMSCKNAHVLPSKMPPQVRDEIRGRLQKILKAA
jgi:hypothetical protein